MTPHFLCPLMPAPVALALWHLPPVASTLEVQLFITVSIMIPKSAYHLVWSLTSNGTARTPDAWKSSSRDYRVSKSFSTILHQSTSALYNATTAQSFSDEDFAVKRSKQPRPTLLPHHVLPPSHLICSLQLALSP
jgi:hypothetical protein